MAKTEYAYRQWFKVCQAHYNGLGIQDGRTVVRFAKSQWELFWSGVRDARLHDLCVWLIDKHGYKAKKES